MAARSGDGLREGLRELGYIEGHNIRIEYRWAQGNFERLTDLAAELVRLKVDVIVTFVTQASLAAKKATATIPIVMVGVANPVGTGLVASLAQAGGNVTRASSVATDVVGKQLDRSNAALPRTESERSERPCDPGAADGVVRSARQCRGIKDAAGKDYRQDRNRLIRKSLAALTGVIGRESGA